MNFYRIAKNKKKPPYIIAEIGSNHNGNMQLCKKLILAAKKNGADAVKFQMFSSKNLFSNQAYNKYFNEKEIDKHSVTIKNFKKIQIICKKLKIDFGITPLSFEECDAIDKNLKVDFYKIASMDSDNIEFIKHVAKKNKPTIISTGFIDSKLLQKSVSAFLKTGNKKLSLLHCTALYPPKDNQINLNRITTLKKMFKNIPIGFSDHTLGINFSLAAIALGARIIEKHFTLNKKLKGWDHHMSIDTKDLENLTSLSKRINNSLGSEKIQIIENNNQVKNFKRSIVSSVKIKKGTTIRRSMLDFKRPGNGLHTRNISKIIGRKAKKDILENNLIRWSDLS